MLLPKKCTSWSVLIKVILLFLCLIIFKNAHLAYGDHAFVWDNGTWIDLAPFAASETSRAWGINDNGHIVGEGVHVLLSEDGEITDLGTSEPCGRSANDINNQGQSTVAQNGCS